LELKNRQMGFLLLSLNAIGFGAVVLLTHSTPLPAGATMRSNTLDRRPCWSSSDISHLPAFQLGLASVLRAFPEVPCGPQIGWEHRSQREVAADRWPGACIMAMRQRHWCGMPKWLQETLSRCVQMLPSRQTHTHTHTHTHARARIGTYTQ